VTQNVLNRLVEKSVKVFKTAKLINIHQSVLFTLLNNILKSSKGVFQTFIGVKFNKVIIK